MQDGRPGFNPWVGKIPWRREWQPTPVFWPGEFNGLYSPWSSWPPPLASVVRLLLPAAALGLGLRGVGQLLPAAAPDLGRGLTPLGHRPSGMGSSWLLPLTSDVGVAPLGRAMTRHVAAACAMARVSQSLTQSQTSWNVKSNGPQKASLQPKLVEVMEFQLSYSKS